MAVKYDFFLTPQPKEKQQKVKYHARTVVDKTFTNKDIATEISKRCTINKAEAMAVMDEMADIFLQKLSEGHAIKLEGIGTFHTAPRVLPYEPRKKSVRKASNEEVSYIGQRRSSSAN